MINRQNSYSNNIGVTEKAADYRPCNKRNLIP